MKKWVSVLLLFSLVATLVPRSWVHSHDDHQCKDHSSISFKALEHTDQEADNDCLACDFDLGLFASSHYFAFHFEGTFYNKPSTNHYESLPSPLSGKLRLRGPPSLT